jgi:lysophospholipase L1-like esterase
LPVFCELASFQAMKIGIRHIILILAAAACGFGMAHWLDSGDIQFGRGNIHKTGNTSFHNSRLVMRPGSTLMLELSEAKNQRSCIITFDIDFTDTKDFAIVATGTDGSITLVDAGIGLGLISEYEKGLMEIGFENERVFVQFDALQIREMPYDSSKLRSLTIEAKNSELSIGGLSAVARHWVDYSPIQTSVLIDLDFKTTRSVTKHQALIVALSILIVLVYGPVEKYWVYMFAKPHPRALQSSQAFAFTLLGAGLTLAAVTSVFEGTQNLFFLGFLYHRLRFTIFRTDLCVATKISPLTTLLFIFSTTGASLCVALAFRNIAAAQLTALVAGFCTTSFFIALARIYSHLQKTRFNVGLASVGWAGLPMTLALIIPEFLPFGVLALAWPVVVKRKSMKYAGPMMLLVSLMAFPAVELTVRANVHERLLRPANLSPEFEEHNLLFYAPRNFFQYRQDYLTRDNYIVEALNLRGGAVSFKKPEGVFRILVLGGSNAWGDGIADPKETFSGRLEAILNEKHAPQKFQVLNGGVRGYNGFQIMVFFTRYAYKFNPDLVLLYMNRNDVVSLRGIEPLRKMFEKKDKYWSLGGVKKLFRGLAFYNLMSRRLARARSEFGVITNIEKVTLLDVNPPEDVKRNMQNIIEKATQIGAKSLIVSEFWGSIWHEQTVEERFFSIRSATQALVSELGVPYFDAYMYFRHNFELWDVAFRHDPVHMTPYAHEMLAKKLYEFLDENSLLPHYEKSNTPE